MHSANRRLFAVQRRQVHHLKFLARQFPRGRMTQLAVVSERHVARCAHRPASDQSRDASRSMPATSNRRLHENDSFRCRRYVRAHACNRSRCGGRACARRSRRCASGMVSFWLPRRWDRGKAELARSIVTTPINCQCKSLRQKAPSPNGSDKNQCHSAQKAVIVLDNHSLI